MTHEEFLKIRFKVCVNPMGGYTIQDCGDIIEEHKDKVVANYRCRTLNDYEAFRVLAFNPPEAKRELNNIYTVIYEMSNGATLEQIKEDLEKIKIQIATGHSFFPQTTKTAKETVTMLENMFKAIDILKVSRKL